MGINQAIYTSSARGINKGGGMGVHTYNRACSETELRKFERSYCQYYVDSHMKNIHGLPTKMVYGKIENGSYMAACVTYLGKDYDKERGRMGNILSHMYSFTGDSLHVYPMQLFGSPDYRISMAQEEVDGTKPVEYLPEVDDVRCGTLVSRECVQEFLSEGRTEMFCHLLSAVLHRGDIHKVIISDTHENIVMWLGAVEFALPLQSAREVTFSSYEKNPLMSEFDIRGAVVGMSTGNCKEYMAGGQFFVFDGIERRYPELDVTADYFQQGLHLGWGISQRSLEVFFRFMERYSYEKADCDVFSGFKLYQVIQGKTEQPSKEYLDEAMSFEVRYGNIVSYRKMLSELSEKMEKDTDPDECLLSNIRIILMGYLKRELTCEELIYGLELIGRLDGYVSDHGCNTMQNNKMWQALYMIFEKYQQKYWEEIRLFLVDNRLYQRLAEFSAYFYHTMDEEDDVARLKSIFYKDWEGIVPAEYGYFDTVVCAAVLNIEKFEDSDKKYRAATELFLLLRDMGKGYIAGEGCEHLIGIIEDAICITEKKQFQGKRKRKRDKESDEKFARCAQEVFAYSRRTQTKLPMAKIRLRHLGMCIAKAYAGEEPLMRVKDLKIYVQYPIDISDISDEEWAAYIEQVAEIVNTMETDRDEYNLLLTFWILNSVQKEYVLRAYMDHEMDYFRKEREIGGLGSLLGAVRELKDEAYQQTLDAYVSEMKKARKSQVTRAILKKCRDYGLYEYWIKMARAEKDTNVRNPFLRHGRK